MSPVEEDSYIPLLSSPQRGFAGIIVTGVESSKELKPSGLKVIWFFLKPYKLRIISLLFLSLIVGVLETTCVAIVYPILGSGLDIKLGQDNILFSLINAIATVLPIEDTFISYCIFFVLIAILAFMAKLALINLRVHVTSDAVSGNIKNVFEKYMGADYQYFIDHKQGELIYNASTAPRGISVLMTAVTTLLSEAILAISIFILLFSISWRGTIGTILLVVVYYYVTKYLGTKISYFTGKGRAEATILRPGRPCVGVYSGSPKRNTLRETVSMVA